MSSFVHISRRRKSKLKVNDLINYTQDEKPDPASEIRRYCVFVVSLTVGGGRGVGGVSGKV